MQCQPRVKHLENNACLLSMYNSRLVGEQVCKYFNGGQWLMGLLKLVVNGVAVDIVDVVVVGGLLFYT